MRILLLLAFLPAPASAYQIALSTAGAPLHWTASEVTLTIDADAPSRHGAKAAALLDEACAAWSQLPESSVLLDQGPARVNHVRFVQHDWPYGADMLAFTVLEAHPSTGVIESATIEVNEQDHEFSLESDPQRSNALTYDLGAVLTHELGHVLGLGHSTELDATMFSSTAPWDAHQRLPDADDRAGLAALYAQAEPADPAPSTPTTSATPTNMPPLATARGCSYSGGGRDLGGLMTMVLLLLTLVWRSVNSPRGRASRR